MCHFELVCGVKFSYGKTMRASHTYQKFKKNTKEEDSAVKWMIIKRPTCFPHGISQNNWICEIIHIY